MYVLRRSSRKAGTRPAPAFLAPAASVPRVLVVRRQRLRILAAADRTSALRAPSTTWLPVDDRSLGAARRRRRSRRGLRGRPRAARRPPSCRRSRCAPLAVRVPVSRRLTVTPQKDDRSARLRREPAHAGGAVAHSVIVVAVSVDLVRDARNLGATTAPVNAQDWPPTSRRRFPRRPVRRRRRCSSWKRQHLHASEKYTSQRVFARLTHELARPRPRRPQINSIRMTPLANRTTRRVSRGLGQKPVRW